MRKETLVVIPGMACDHSVYQYQMEHLSDLVKSVVVDLNGADTIEKMVAKVMDDKPDTFYLAGHSLGGYVCLEVMRRHPQPTQVIVGRGDPFFFNSSQQIATGIKGAEFVVIEQCGHMLTMECPEETTEQMRRWLSP